MKRRVAVALSGGVDSAVAAILLKRRPDIDLVGAVHMWNWDPRDEEESLAKAGRPSTSSCPQTKDERDARRIAERLCVPFHLADFSAQYWSLVFQPLLEGYERGETRVPDVCCNRLVKFDLLHEFCRRKLGADFVATGHYATTSFGDFQERRQRRSSGDESIRLLRATDPLKDQTYFLATLDQAQLKRSMFPVGSLTKTRVKEIAKEEGLHETATRDESMGVCFVGKKADFPGFLESYIEETRQGPILRIDDGLEIGKHRGVHRFTAGKRIGKAGIRPEFYSNLGYRIVDVDAERNAVYVCEGSQHPALFASEIKLAEEHWIDGRGPDWGEVGELSIDALVQRNWRPLPARLTRAEDGENLLSLRLEHPLRAAAIGQTCAFYVGRECIGSAVIKRVARVLRFR